MNSTNRMILHRKNASEKDNFNRPRIFISGRLASCEICDKCKDDTPTTADTHKFAHSHTSLFTPKRGESTDVKYFTSYFQWMVMAEGQITSKILYGI